MKQEIVALLDREPFSPFRIKLVNGDAHDVSDASIAAPLRRSLYLAPHDGEWVEFPYNRIASLESLLEF